MKTIAVFHANQRSVRLCRLGNLWASLAMFRVATVVFILLHSMAADGRVVWKSSENPSTTWIPCSAAEVVIDTQRPDPFVLQDCHTDVNNSAHNTEAFGHDAFPSLALMRAYRKIVITAQRVVLLVWNSTLQTISYVTFGAAVGVDDGIVIHVTSSTFVAAHSAVVFHKMQVNNVTFVCEGCRAFLSDDDIQFDGDSKHLALVHWLNLDSGRVFIADSYVVVYAHVSRAGAAERVQGALIGKNEVNMRLVSVINRIRNGSVVIHRSKLWFFSGNINASDTATTKLQVDLTIPEANTAVIAAQACYDLTLVVENVTWHCEGSTYCVAIGIGSVFVYSVNISLTMNSVNASTLIAGPRKTTPRGKLRRTTALVDIMRASSLVVACTNSSLAATIVPNRGPLEPYDSAVSSNLECSLLVIAPANHSTVRARQNRIACTIPAESLPLGGLQSVVLFSAVHMRGLSSVTIAVEDVVVVARLLAVVCAPLMRWNAVVPGAAVLNTPSVVVMLSTSAVSCYEAEDIDVVVRSAMVTVATVPQLCPQASYSSFVSTIDQVPLLAVTSFSRLICSTSVFAAAHAPPERMRATTVLDEKDFLKMSSLFGIEFSKEIMSEITTSASVLGSVDVSNSSVTLVALSGFSSSLQAPQYLAAVNSNSPSFVDVVVINQMRALLDTSIVVHSSSTHITNFSNTGEYVTPTTSPLWWWSPPLVRLNNCSNVSNVTLVLTGLRQVGGPIAYYDALVEISDVHQQTPAQPSTAATPLTIRVSEILRQSPSLVVRSALVVSNDTNISTSFRFTSVSYRSHSSSVRAPLLYFLDGLKHPASEVIVECVERNDAYIPVSYVAEPVAAVAVTYSRVCPPPREAVDAPPVQRLPMMLRGSMVVSFALPQAPVSLSMVQSTQRALMLAQRCVSQEEGEGSDDFMSSALDNPLQLHSAAGGVPSALTAAVGSIFGNLLLVVAYPIGAVAAWAAYAAVVQRQRVSARLLAARFAESGGVVASFAVPYWALAQPIATAAAGTAATALQGQSTSGGAAVLLASACIGFAFVVTPAVLWLHRILWVWRGARCPYQLRQKRLPVVQTPPVSRPGPLAAAVHTLRLLVRRLLFPAGAVSVWAPRRCGGKRPTGDRQFLAVVDQYTIRRRWFLAVDVGVVVMCGTVGGAAWAAADCTWSLWVLLTLSAGQCVAVAILRPLLSRADTVLVIVSGALGVISIALSAGSDGMDAASTIATVQCVVTLLSPILSLIAFAERFISFGLRTTSSAFFRSSRRVVRRSGATSCAPHVQVEALQDLIALICMRHVDQRDWPPVSTVSACMRQ